MTDSTETAERLARIETRIEYIVKTLENLPMSPIVTERLQDVDKRIKELEKRQNYFMGAIAMANVFLLFFQNKILALFG